MLYSAVFACVGGIVGAKLLSILTSIPIIIAYNLSFMDIIKNGFVFYGGLLGGIFGLYIYLKIYKCKKIEFLDTFAVSVPLGHALGRLGCFFSGCCYGIPHDGVFSYTYHTALNLNTPLDVPLLAIQFIECIVLLFIFIFLVILYYTTKRPGISLVGYLFSYSTARFILEFFRGDKERGLFLYLSTSQWISIGLFLSGFCVLAWMLTKQKNLKTEIIK